MQIQPIYPIILKHVYFYPLYYLLYEIPAYMISGINVTIPAHYHGSIVAVTLSLLINIIYWAKRFNKW